MRSPSLLGFPVVMFSFSTSTMNSSKSKSGSLSPTFGWLGSTSRTCFLKREALFCLLRVRGGMIEDGAVLRLFMATMQTAVIE